MSARVIVSNVAIQHAYETAAALQEKGLLKRLYTTFYSKVQPTALERVVQRILPSSLKKNASNRNHTRLRDELVESIVLPEAIERINQKLRWLNEFDMHTLKFRLFDNFVAQKDLRCDAFHGFEGCSMLSMKKAKALGAKIVLDEAMCHVDCIQEVMREEHRRLNLPFADYLKENSALTRRKREEYELADLVIVPSEKIRKDFIARTGRDAASVICIPLGVDLQRFSPQPSARQDSIFRVLCVGIVGLRKGIHYLLEAFKQLKLPNAELLIISPIEKEFLPVLEKYSGLYRHIWSMPNNQLSQYYNDSSVFVLPSVFDSFGFVTLEAMACGVPVIVTENCGLQPRDGVDGFVVPIRSVEAIKEKLLYFYEQPEKRRQMGESAAQYAKRFSWETYRRRLGRLYDSWLQNKLPEQETQNFIMEK